MDVVRAGRIVSLLLGVLAVSRPASAQIDLSGEWSVVRAEDNVGNTELGDWVGIPMNDASRLRSTAWDASIQTLPEWQCRPHGSAYISRGPSALKIWKEVDPVSRETTAWHLEWLRSVDRPIYMDGRPHPSPNAAHTWAGFSTGEWVGDMLRVSVTHLKEEYLKRNGVWHSDKIELTQYLIRRGDYLTYLVDRVRPRVPQRAARSEHGYRLNVNQQIPPYPCTVVTEVDRPKGVVPHYLPGHEQRHLLVLATLRDSDGRGDGRRRQHVSGNSRQDPALARRIRSRAAPLASHEAHGSTSRPARRTRAVGEPRG